eukprot:gene20262-27016_t
MATLQQTAELFQKFKVAYTKNDLSSADATLAQLKLKLIQLPSLPPLFAQSPTAQDELLLARDILEHAVLLSVKKKNEASMERSFTQVKNFYSDTKDLLPQSEQEPSMLDLGLSCLLVQETPFVKHAVQLEQWLMVGSYNKVLEAAKTLPSEFHAFFMQQLASTVRDEIASCSEKAYEKLRMVDARKLMMFDSDAAVQEYASNHGWQVEGGYILSFFYFRFLFKTSNSRIDSPMPGLRFATIRESRDILPGNDQEDRTGALDFFPNSHFQKPLPAAYVARRDGAAADCDERAISPPSREAKSAARQAHTDATREIRPGKEAALVVVTHATRREERAAEAASRDTGLAGSNEEGAATETSRSATQAVILAARAAEETAVSPAHVAATRETKVAVAAWIDAAREARCAESAALADSMSPALAAAARGTRAAEQAAMVVATNAARREERAAKAVSMSPALSAAHETSAPKAASRDTGLACINDKRAALESSRSAAQAVISAARAAEKASVSPAHAAAARGKKGAVAVWICAAREARFAESAALADSMSPAPTAATRGTRAVKGAVMVAATNATGREE